MSSEISFEEQLIGAVTGGYRVLSRIGSGTMGHVYEAEAVESGTRVALKVLRNNHQKELAARFLREGKTLALLSHPNIVQLVDMGQLDDGTLFLATELVPGGSLRDLMDRGPVEHRRALGLVRQLLDALQAAHDLGVVHRDIKPENVMVADGDVVKVLDFGVAKLLQDTVAGLGAANLTSAGFSVFGSALYIAPESVTGQAVDARIDLYSTGAMLFEMVAGRPPFDDEDPMVIMRAHAFTAPPTLQQAAPAQRFVPELEALIARALAKKPADRYGSAADMIVALDAALQALAPAPPVESTPVIVQQRLPTETVRRPDRRKLVIAGLAAVALVVAIAAATRGGSSVAGAVTSSLSPEQAASLLATGHSQLAEGRIQQALAAYERALHAAPKLGGDAELRANLGKILDGKDVLGSTVALELLAALTPPAHEAIVAYASNGKLEVARHRAVMLAERDGIEAKIDRVQSAMLDLQQATSCEERKASIEQLAQRGDRRAIGALKKARAMKCVEQDAANAIARIEATQK
jgi:serine/threonine protein kinase